MVKYQICCGGTEALKNGTPLKERHFGRSLNHLDNKLMLDLQLTDEVHGGSYQNGTTQLLVLRITPYNGDSKSS